LIESLIVYSQDCQARIARVQNHIENLKAEREQLQTLVERTKTGARHGFYADALTSLEADLDHFNNFETPLVANVYAETLLDIDGFVK
jgi:hypothetical protein